MVSLQRPTNEQQQQPESSSLRPFLPRLHSVGEEEALVSGLCLCVGVCLYFCVYICNIIIVCTQIRDRAIHAVLNNSHLVRSDGTCS